MRWNKVVAPGDDKSTHMCVSRINFATFLPPPPCEPDPHPLKITCAPLDQTPISYNLLNSSYPRISTYCCRLSTLQDHLHSGDLSPPSNPRKRSYRKCEDGSASPEYVDISIPSGYPPRPTNPPARTRDTPE